MIRGCYGCVLFSEISLRECSFELKYFRMAQKQIKILLYTPAFYPKVDGIVRRVNNFLDSIKALNETSKSVEYQILVICPKFENGCFDIFKSTKTLMKPREIHHGFQVIRLPSFKPSPKLAPDSYLAHPLAFSHLNHIISRWKPDLIHSIGPDFFFITILIVCKLFYRNIPILASYHQHNQQWINNQPVNALQRAFLSQIFKVEKIIKYSDGVMSPSEAIREYLLSKLGIKCEYLWEPAVDCSVFRPATEFGFTFHASNPVLMDANGKYQNNDSIEFEPIIQNGEDFRRLVTFQSVNYEDCPILLYVGRIAHEKSIDWLIRLIELVPNAYLAVIGDGPMKKTLSEMHGSKNRIFFSSGFWSGNMLSLAYAYSDIFVMPSSFETLGNVCMEAMASGCVVVARSQGGIPDIVQPNRGILLRGENDCFEGFVKSVQDLIESRQEWISDCSSKNHRDRIKECLEKLEVCEKKFSVNGEKKNIYESLLLEGYKFARSRCWIKSTSSVLETYLNIIENKRFRNKKRFIQAKGLIRRIICGFGSEFK